MVKKRVAWLWEAMETAYSDPAIRALLKARYQLYKAGLDHINLRVETEIRERLRFLGVMPRFPFEETTYDHYRYTVDRIPKEK